MRDVVTKQRRLSLPGCKPRISPEYFIKQELIYSNSQSSAEPWSSSIGNIFRVTGHLCGEFTGPRWIPRTKAVTRSFDVYFDMHPNKRLSKQ